MLDYRTSELYQMLVRQGVAKLPAGTDGMAKRGAGDAGGGIPQRPLTDAAAGEPRIRLVVNNTALRQRTAGAVPFLKIVGGK